MPTSFSTVTASPLTASCATASSLKSTCSGLSHKAWDSASNQPGSSAARTTFRAAGSRSTPSSSLSTSGSCSRCARRTSRSTITSFRLARRRRTPSARLAGLARSTASSTGPTSASGSGSESLSRMSARISSGPSFNSAATAGDLCLARQRRATTRCCSSSECNARATMPSSPSAMAQVNRRSGSRDVRPAWSSSRTHSDASVTPGSGATPYSPHQASVIAAAAQGRSGEPRGTAPATSASRRGSIPHAASAAEYG